MAILEQKLWQGESSCETVTAKQRFANKGHLAFASKGATVNLPRVLVGAVYGGVGVVKKAPVGFINVARLAS
jgi:hypothetical protein